MIDTVCLLIPKDRLSFLSDVVNWKLNSKTEHYEKFVRNPSATEEATGQYFPRLTGCKRRFPQVNTVRIEFSVPKLMFLNNLDELEEKDFPKVITTLKERLQTMGVTASEAILEDASVSSVHFSKNIKLEDGYTSSHLISEMNKVNLRKTLDFARSRFTNDGQSLHFHANSHQFVVYDKILDMEKDKKRAIDKDQTTYQQSLFEEVKKQTMLEVIRFEVRLIKKPKMNKVIKDLGYAKNPTFKEVFNVEMSRRVVTDYWERLIKKPNLGLFSMSLSLKDMLQTLFLADKKLKPKQAIYLLGLYTLAKDENGMRQLRSIVSKRSHDRTWYRIVKDTQQASDLITKNKLRDWVTQIDTVLEEYTPYRCKKLSTL